MDNHSVYGLLGTGITTILDRRVPQPTAYEDYGVPPGIVPAIEALYRRRHVCPDREVLLIDEALMRLLWPWIQRGQDVDSIKKIPC